MTAPAALLLKLRWRPWLAAVVGVTALFIVAVVVVTFSKLVLPRVRVDKNDAIKDTVDRFNAISGALMSVADEPLVFAVKAFVPVVFTLVLRPMANPTLDTNEVTGQWRHQITKSTRAIACVAITAAVTNALASVNLQHVETSFEARMSATDAKVLRPADVNNATSFFQSLVGSRQSFVDSKCTGGNGSTGYTPSVRFDLQARPFFQDILPMTIEPNQTRSFSMDLQRALNETVIEHEVGEMPFHSSIANALLALSARLEYNASKSEAEQLAQTHELALKEFISFPGNTTKSMGFELKHEHANITFSRTLLASHVVFDSVTIDSQHSAKSGDAFCRECINDRQWSKATILAQRCGSSACFSVIRVPSSRVTAYQFCNVSTALSGQPVECSDNDNSGQLILYSVGRRIEGQELQLIPKANGSSSDEKSSDKKAVIIGIRPVSSITVGILRWEVSQLDETYQAACDDEVSRCRGIALTVPRREKASNATNSSRVIMVSRDHIQTARLPPMMSSLRMDLAVSTSNFVLIRPSNFAVSDTWRERSGSDCDIGADNLIAEVMANHIYSDESFHSACTGGLLFLFQNGQAFDSIPRISTQPNGPQTFAFAGNRRSIELVASLPMISAYISIASCAVLVVLVIFVPWHAHGVNEEGCKEASATKVIQVLVDDQQFPKALLRCEIGSGNHSCDLTALEPSILQLRCESNECVVLDEAKELTRHASESPKPMTARASLSEESKKTHSIAWIPDIPLLVHLHHSRLVVSTITLVCAYVGLLSILMGDGVVLHTVTDEKQVEASVQRYSFYSGTLGAILAAPAGLLVHGLAAAHSLTVVSPTPLFKHCALGAKLLGVWSLTTAINSINVQPGERVDPRIGIVDLASLPSAVSNQNLTTVSTNSVLRSFLAGVDPEVDFKCSKLAQSFSVSDEAASMRRQHANRPDTTFAFTRESWHSLMMSKPTTTTEVVMFTESSNITNSSVMPIDPEQVAGQIALSAFMHPLFRGDIDTEAIASEVIQRALKNPRQEYSNMDLKIARYQVTENITFDVVTMRYDRDELWDMVSSFSTNTTRNNSFHDASGQQTWKLNLECSASGCASFHEGLDFAELDVRVAPLCSALENEPDGPIKHLLVPLVGNYRDALSVVGKSSYVTGDSMRLVSINQVMPSENDHDKQAVNHTVELVNPTRRYEISAGILRWTTYDLANSHGAKCIDANSSCMGFQYPLDGNSSQVLLVEKNRLFQNRYTLAMNVQSRLIRPSNFRSQVGNPAIFQGDNCSLLAENYIEYVEKNHLFMDRDQIEYVSSVAGMFHLFEKARLYDVIHVIEQARPNEQNQDSTATTLSFDGNIKFVHLGVMIPNDAAIVSFVSMFGLLGVSLLLLLMELLVWSDDDSEPRMTQATVSETAEVMMDDMQYPKNFLTALILLKPASEDGIQATALRELATLTVEGVTLRLRSPVDVSKASVLWELQNSHSRQRESTVESSIDSTGELEEQAAIA